MILSIYLSMLLIMVILLIIGYATKQVYMTLLAYAFMFILAVVLMTPGIQYTIGKNITDSGLTMLIVDNLGYYQNTKLGLYLAFVSVGAFVVTIWQWRSLSNDE